MSGAGNPLSSAVDASIPLRAGQGVAPPQNPLATIGQFVGIQNQINHGKIQNQTIQSNQLSLIQQHKALAYAQILPAVLGGRINNMADLTSALGALEHYGINTQPVTADIVQTVMQGGDFVGNLKRQALAGAQSPENAAKAITPSPVDVDQGPQVQPGLRGAPGTPEQGIVTPTGPAIPKFPGPEQQTGFIERPATAAEAAQLGIPPGTPIKVPNISQASQSGTLPLYGPAARGVVSENGQPVGPQNQPRLTGQIGNQPQPKFDPQTGQPLTFSTAPPPMPTGARPVGPSNPNPAPGLKPFISAPPVGMQDSQANSAKAYDAAMVNDAQFQRRIFPLKEAMTALSGTSTGPGTETINHIKSFLQARAPELYTKLVGQQGSDQIKNYDLSVKYLADWVAQQGGSQRSDMAQTLAATSSPSTHISQAAARQVLGAALGLENMQHAAATEFTASQGGQANGSQFLSWMNQNFTPNADPHGYAWGSLPRDTRAQIWKSASPEEKQRLFQSYQKAQQLKLTPPVQ
jgi:hypothetical protein